MKVKSVTSFLLHPVPAWALSGVPGSSHSPKHATQVNLPNVSVNVSLHGILSLCCCPMKSYSLSEQDPVFPQRHCDMPVPPTNLVKDKHGCIKR